MNIGNVLENILLEKTYSVLKTGADKKMIRDKISKKTKNGDAWVAQSVKFPTLAKVMISGFVSSSPASVSVLIAQSVEPASDSVSPSLFAPSLFMLCVSQK